MDRPIVRYRFDATVPVQELEGTLLLAVLAAESLHGEATVALDARFAIDPERCTLVIDAGTDAGRTIARVFGGYVRHEFGAGSYTVERLSDREVVGPAAAPAA